jgi:poly(A) polymerase/tRNA nucleotidyltransferase (CCA-adding enzyme)
MDRSNDLLIPGGTPWLTDPNARRVWETLRAGGHYVYFVGGCVRNALLGMEPGDVDLCTDALPERVMELGTAAGLKALPTGIDHGTVTLVVDGTAFEVTTLRKDVETDGRRAVVAFTKDITEDAVRRDFTMNALYATPEGFVVDPLNGIDDLRARRVRFIQDPVARIQEDYLRVLRFFRFSAWYANPEDGFDAEALAAISDNIKGLKKLSAERVGQEMRKLLSAPDPAPAIATMRQIGALHAILPGTDDRWLGMVIHHEAVLGFEPSWIMRLAILGGDHTAALLRLSRAEANELHLLRNASPSATSIATLAYRHNAAIAQRVLVLRAAMSEQPVQPGILDVIEIASQAIFPIKAQDLMPRYERAALGRRLGELEDAWIASDFTLSRDDLLKLR